MTMEPVRANRIGDIGLTLVLLGWLGGVLACWPWVPELLLLPYKYLVLFLTFLSPVGLVFGLIGLSRAPRRSSRYAIALAVLAQFVFVGTIWSMALIDYQSQ
jgi:hypothetical protein